MANVSEINYKDLPPLDSGVSETMKTEFSISFWLSIFYFIFILSVPILNWTAPAFMRTKIIGGMSITWFLTSIVAMALAFSIAALHVYLYTKKFSAKFANTDAAQMKGGHH